MDKHITLYQKLLDLQNATFIPIQHDDATVAIVYKIISPDREPLILKICSRANDYFRELYYLKYFADKLPVPQIIEVIPPQASIDGALLIECFSGTLLKKTDFTEDLAYEIGSLLARIHLERTAGYGDLTQPQDLSLDPRVHFTMKFEEGLAECSNHLPKEMIEQCRSYFNSHLYLLDSADGPCIIHRDFRPGNTLIHDGKIQGIIDWSAARSSFAQEDFVILEDSQWPYDPIFKRSFLAGYSSIRPVPDNNGMMPLLRLNRAIAIIGFTVKRGTWQSSDARIYQFNRQFLETFLNSLK